MEIIKIESGPDCKIITCKDEYHRDGCPKTMRFLGETYKRMGWSTDLTEVYYKASRTPVPFN